MSIIFILLFLIFGKGFFRWFKFICQKKLFWAVSDRTWAGPGLFGPRGWPSWLTSWGSNPTPSPSPLTHLPRPPFYRHVTRRCVWRRRRRGPGRSPLWPAPKWWGSGSPLWDLPPPPCWFDSRGSGRSPPTPGTLDGSAACAAQPAPASSGAVARSPRCYPAGSPPLPPVGWQSLQPRRSQVPVMRCVQWRSGDGRSTIVVLLQPRRRDWLDSGARTATTSAVTTMMLPTRCLPRAPSVSSPL
jgi:hypothetical protein